MTNLLLLSHSLKLVEGLKELLTQVAPSVDIEISGGTFDGEIGSNFEEVMEKMSKLSDGQKLVIIFDMGSSMLNAQTAYEMIDEKNKENIILADSPMVESAIQIAIMAESDVDFEEIKEYVQNASLKKI